MTGIPPIEKLEGLAWTDAEIEALQRRAGADRRRGHIGRRSGAPLNDAERALLIEDRELVETPSLVAVRAWLASATNRETPGRTALALCGPEGTGRTVAAAWALAREGGRWRTIDELLHRYARATSSRARVDERNELERWRSAGVFVVTDVGGESTALERRALGALLEARGGVRSRLTILTTLLSSAEFIERAKGAWDARLTEWLIGDVDHVDLGDGGGT